MGAWEDLFIFYWMRQSFSDSDNEEGRMSDFSSLTPFSFLLPAYNLCKFGIEYIKLKLRGEA